MSIKLIKTFLNPEGHHNRITGSKVFLDGGTLPIGGVALGSRLVVQNTQVKGDGFKLHNMMADKKRYHHLGKIV